MANIIQINGVTKREVSTDIFEYYFPTAFIQADNSSNEIQITQFTAGKSPAYTLALADITEKYGATTAEQYCDALATNSIFFYPDLTTGTTVVTIEGNEAGTSELNSSFEILTINILENIKKHLESIDFHIKTLSE